MLSSAKYASKFNIVCIILYSLSLDSDLTAAKVLVSSDYLTFLFVILLKDQVSSTDWIPDDPERDLEEHTDSQSHC